MTQFNLDAKLRQYENLLFSVESKIVDYANEFLNIDLKGIKTVELFKSKLTSVLLNSNSNSKSKKDDEDRNKQV